MTMIRKARPRDFLSVCLDGNSLLDAGRGPAHVSLLLTPSGERQPTRAAGSGAFPLVLPRILSDVKFTETTGHILDIAFR